MKKQILIALLISAIMCSLILSGCKSKQNDPSISSSSANSSVTPTSSQQNTSSTGSSSVNSSDSSVVSLVSDSTGPMDSDEVKAKVQKYYNLGACRMSDGDTIFKELGLTNETIYGYNNTDWVEVDSDKFYGTEIQYADYKNAMLQYVSENHFEDVFIKSFGFTEHNGQIYSVGFGGTGYQITIETAQYKGKNNLQYQYEVSGEIAEVGGTIPFTSQVNFIEENNQYVIDSADW